jgi:hypothetical protein
VVGSRGDARNRRAGTCPWKSGYRSPTCTWAGPAFGQSRAGSAARPRRSVVSYGATAPRQRPGGRGSTRRTLPKSRPRCAVAGPRPAKFDHAELATVVQSRLCVKWSPEQISLHLAETFPERAEMRVCPEAIYQALYVQGRGHLGADLHRHLRTGRAVRRPRGSSVTKRGKIPNMILISERPAEVADRAVPGHWDENVAGQGVAARCSVRKPGSEMIPAPVRHATHVSRLRSGHEAREQKRNKPRPTGPH